MLTEAIAKIDLSTGINHVTLVPTNHGHEFQFSEITQLHDGTLQELIIYKVPMNQVMRIHAGNNILYVQYNIQLYGHPITVIKSDSTIVLRLTVEEFSKQLQDYAIVKQFNF